GLGHPPRQTRGGHSARLGLPQLRGLLPALVVRRTPAAAVAVVLRRRGRRLLARVPRAARGAARGGSAARKPGVGQLVDGGVGRSGRSKPTPSRSPASAACVDSDSWVSAGYWDG